MFGKRISFGADIYRDIDVALQIMHPRNIIVQCDLDAPSEEEANIKMCKELLEATKHLI